jgi:hypothetical protein
MYLEKLLAHIDCPRLDRIAISYLIFGEVPDVEQLPRFVDRTISPPFTHATVCFDPKARDVTFDLYRPTHRTTGRGDSHPAASVISCQMIDRHFFRTLKHFSGILSSVVQLKFIGKFWESYMLHGEYNLEWLHYLHQFPALRALYVSSPFAEGVGHAMKSVKG